MPRLIPTMVALAVTFTLAGPRGEDLPLVDPTPRMNAASTTVNPTTGPGGGAPLARIAIRRTIHIPRDWKLRHKHQLKLRKAGVVDCERSNWRTSRKGGSRAYARVTLTCSAPSDARSRRVALINRRRPAQRKTVAFPVIIGHRGAPDLYPEESIEGYDYVARLGIPLEVDLRPLADGSLVPLHDATIDRTTTGTGPVDSIVVEEWRSLRIKPAPGSDSYGHTLTWDDVMNRYGGWNVIVAEVKTNAIAQRLADSIIAHGLQRTAIVQTWSRVTARRLDRQGIRVLLLTSRKPAPDRVAGTGAEFIGVNVGLSRLARYMGRLQAAGVAPVVWTPASTRDARRVLRAGAAGVFSDNPAALLHRPQWTPR